MRYNYCIAPICFCTSYAIFLIPSRQLPPASADRPLLGLCLMQCIHTYYYFCSICGDMISAYPEISCTIAEIPWIAPSKVVGIIAAAHPQNKDCSCYFLGMLLWIKGTEQNLVVIVYVMHCRSSCLLSQRICTASSGDPTVSYSAWFRLGLHGASVE